MSTIEEFENAPAGSIAKTKTGLAAWREGDQTDDHPWVCTTCGEWLTNENMAERDYTLVPVARPLPTRDEVTRVLEDTFWPFLAHDPADPERFWGQATDAVLALLRKQDA